MATMSAAGAAADPAYLWYMRKAYGNKALGDFLKRKRATLKLTQEQVAEAAETSKPTVQRVEAGLRNPSRDLLLRLARAVGADETEALSVWSRQDEASLVRLIEGTRVELVDEEGEAPVTGELTEVELAALRAMIKARKRPPQVD